MSTTAPFSAAEPLPREATPASSYLIASCVCAATLVALLPRAPELAHWFVLPVLLCGILVVADGVEWARGRLDRFDPRGLIGLLGFHFFFLAPLLHVTWRHFMDEVTPPPDWRDWLGRMALLNAVGLVIYRASLAALPLRPPADLRPAWVLDRRRFFALLAAALPLTAALQVWVYAQYGGIAGYIEVATSQTSRNTMPGMGLVFMFSESFPILALLGYAVWTRGRERVPSWATLAMVLAVFFVLVLFFGGLRANRSNTIWNLFWAVGVLHFWVRPVPLKWIGVGLVFLVAFMYAYGLYKGAGLQGVEALADSESRDAVAGKHNRTLDIVLLDDFGRSDVQAFLLYRLTSGEGDYRLALGRTYAAALAILVPRGLWSDRPPNMAKEGTEAMYGVGTFAPVVAESSRVYGLAGEVMLNFGPVAVPAAFLLWGLGVAWVRRLPTAWAAHDARLLLYPLLIVVAFSMVFQDVENQLFFAIKYGLMPFVVTRLAVRVTPAGWGGGR
ncbi:MAG: hypothetical protein IT429_03875 [Gemmataceae bacterium]|nr:hypothetical protein [Gemmataceae bacterium]